MIVSCGEALIDMVPEPVAGGGPMNVAVAAARLGSAPAFLGALSTDTYGDLLAQHLATNGVDISLCPRVDAPTARAIVEHVPELRFRFEGTGTADTRLDRADLETLLDPPHIVHGGTLGMFRGSTAETLACLVEQHDGIVSLDPNVRPQIIDDRATWNHYHERWLSVTDVYKASDEDLAWIWPERSVDSSAHALLAAGVGAVIVTRGSAGLSVVTRDGEVQVGAPSIDIADTVGAGDTIVAAVLASVIEFGVGAQRADLDSLRLAHWKTIARRAVEAAAITCSRTGADPPTRSELGW